MNGNGKLYLVVALFTIATLLLTSCALQSAPSGSTAGQPAAGSGVNPPAASAAAKDITLLIRCPDARTCSGMMLGLQAKNAAADTLFEAPTIAGGYAPDLLNVVKEIKATRLMVLSHAQFPICQGCGGQDAFKKIMTGKTVEPKRLAQWLEKWVVSSEPYDQVARVGQYVGAELPDQEIVVGVIDHVSQRIKVIGLRNAGATAWRFVPAADWNQARQIQFSNGVPEISREGMSKGLLDLLSLNEAAAPQAGAMAQAAGYADGQTFVRIVLNGTLKAPEYYPHLVRFFTDAGQITPNAYFSVYVPPGESGVNWAVDQVVYAIAHRTPKSDLWLIGKDAQQLSDLVKALNADATVAAKLFNSREWKGAIYATIPSADGSGTVVLKTANSEPIGRIILPPMGGSGAAVAVQQAAKLNQVLVQSDETGVKGVLRVTSRTRGWPQLSGTRQVNVIAVADGVTYEVWLPESVQITPELLRLAGVPMPASTAVEQTLTKLGKFAKGTFVVAAYAGLTYGFVLESEQALGWGETIQVGNATYVIPTQDQAQLDKLSRLGLENKNLFYEVRGPDLISIWNKMHERQNVIGKPCFIRTVDNTSQIAVPLVAPDHDLLTSVFVCPVSLPGKGDPTGIVFTSLVTGEQVVWRWNNKTVGGPNFVRESGPECLAYTAPLRANGQIYTSQFKMCWEGPRAVEIHKAVFN